MDLDFKSVKALASPTRLEILNEVLNEEATTTKLSDRLGKSKSTVSSHLKVLTESGLLEKEDEEGRRRVVYRPTGKAKAIIEGKERKVKFSVVSSALTALTGSILLSRSLVPEKLREQAYALQESGKASQDAGAMTAMDQSGGSGGGMGTMSTETVNRSAEAAAETAAQAGQNAPHLHVEQAMLVIGLGLIVTSAMALAYGYMLSKFRE